MGDTPKRLHWLAIELPHLASSRDQYPGFRANEKGYWMSDKRKLEGKNPVRWARSECWDADEISERGKLPQEIQERQMLVLGAGALGSAIEELLTRAGVKSLTILDPETLVAGNLVRHTLTLLELHQSKSVNVAKRLNRASLNATIEGIQCSFPDIPEEFHRLVRSANVVLDCTGDNDVLSHLETYPWQAEKIFLSFSFGRFAKHLYGFFAQGTSFPRQQYVDAIYPWLERDQETDLTAWPREGIGCWHNVFPARSDDVWLWASVALKQIEQWLLKPPPSPSLSVYEMQTGEVGFSGIQKVG
jgi:molybdopterin/thiamine biosynthesis adenylyltransferase